LAKARIGVHTRDLITGAHGIAVKVTSDRIPVAFVERLRSLCLVLLQPDYLPQQWNDLEFHVPYPVKGVTEVRDGRLMLVGHEIDRGVKESELIAGDPVHSAWTIGSIDFLPITLYGSTAPTSVFFRLRLHGNDRIEIRPRPEDFSFRPHRQDLFFDPGAFFALLSKVFRVPFGSPDGMLTDGSDSDYEGVRVFHGKILSREWAVVGKGPDAPKSPPHWWDEMRLLVTDSDPQYLCVLIVLREQDRPLEVP